MQNDKKTIFGWAMYDWANSAYTTTTLAVLLPIIFSSQIVPEGGFTILGAHLDAETLFAWTVAAGAFLIFAISPALGAVGDFSASKLKFLRFFAFSGAIGSLFFFFPGPGDVWLAIILFLIVEGCWAVAAVFYDSFLPHISSTETMDRVSSKGFAFGYIGGGLQFLLALLLIQFAPEESQDTAARWGIVMAGLWWLGFAAFSFRRLREPGEAEPLPPNFKKSAMNLLKLGYLRTLATAKRLPRFPHLLLFLVAFFIYNDGVQSVISISAIYAEDTLDLDVGQISLAFLAVQVVAFLGAFSFGWLAGRVGTKRAILISLVLWVGITVLGYGLPTGEFLPFLGLASSVGLVLGGTQALSRSLYGSMIPSEASGEFYGFYSVFSKFSAIWGPIIFGAVNQATGSARQAILVFIAQFAVGFVLLAVVNVDKARASKDHWHFRGAEATAE